MDEFTSVLPRRVMTLFLLVDTSGSMASSGNIAKVNRAIEEIIPLLSDISDENEQAEIKLAVMTFDSDVKWVTRDEAGNPGPSSVYDFVWNDVEAAGLTSLAAAFDELNGKLSRKEFMASTTGALAPVIILLSDGYPTDNYKAALERLSHNNWYKVASKIAVAVDDADKDILAEFTRNSEAVLDCDNRTDLKKLMVNLAVVSSTMQSRSVGVENLEAGTSGDLANIGDTTTDSIISQLKLNLDTPLITTQAAGDSDADGDGW